MLLNVGLEGAWFESLEDFGGFFWEDLGVFSCGIKQFRCRPPDGDMRPELRVWALMVVVGGGDGNSGFRVGWEQAERIQVLTFCFYCISSNTLHLTHFTASVTFWKWNSDDAIFLFRTPAASQPLVESTPNSLSWFTKPYVIRCVSGSLNLSQITVP